jgi:hypothetical protein
MAKPFKECAYCGRLTATDREHVIPKALFHKEARKRAHFILVPTCKPCNASFSADEEDFRNFAVVAGPVNEATNDLFWGPMQRAWEDVPKGLGSLRRLREKMKVTEPPDVPGTRVYPDARVMRVIRKMVRGLAYYHSKLILPDERIEVDILWYPIPEEYNEGPQWFVIEPHVCRYARIDENMGDEVHSAWILEIYQTRRFIAWIKK